MCLWNAVLLLFTDFHTGLPYSFFFLLLLYSALLLLPLKDYYLSAKENQCVVCGEQKQYVRHSIVPHSYRRYFHNKYKSRSSHDIVLLCMKCNQVAIGADSRFKEQIAREYKVPLEGTGAKEIVFPEIKKV